MNGAKGTREGLRGDPGGIRSRDTGVGGCRASGLAEDRVTTRPLEGVDGHSPLEWDFTDCLSAEGCRGCITPGCLL